jgi:hypothetical protein
MVRLWNSSLNGIMESNGAVKQGVFMVSCGVVGYQLHALDTFTLKKRTCMLSNIAHSQVAMLLHNIFHDLIVQVFNFFVPGGPLILFARYENNILRFSLFSLTHARQQCTIRIIVKLCHNCCIHGRQDDGPFGHPI